MSDDSVSFFYDEHPAMFKNNPLGFILSIILIPAFGLGILIPVSYTHLTLPTNREV